jgi:parallel beta-helix repeat protein
MDKYSRYDYFMDNTMDRTTGNELKHPRNHFLFLVLGILLLASGCSDNDDPDGNSNTPSLVTLSVSTSGNGRISSTPAGIQCGQNCDHDFDTGSNVTLTATPDTGYLFNGWSGACSGSTPTCDLALSEDKLVTASFIQETAVTRSLSVNVSGDGSISSTPAGIQCGQQCEHDFPQATLVTLTATPEAGYQFDGWSGACSGTTSTCSLDLAEDRTVNASFILIGSGTNSLSVTLSGNGNVISSPAGIQCGQHCQHDFTSGTQVTLTATPEAGYLFNGWSGACSGITATCMLDLNEDLAATASFTPNQAEGESIFVDGELTQNCAGNYSIANRDCSGSDGDAYAKPQQAADVSAAGDTIYFRAGVYYNHEQAAARFPVLHILNSGDVGAPITYTNYAHETVILSGLDNNGDPYKYFTVLLGERPSDQQEASGLGVQNILIEGLIVEGAVRTGLLIAGPADQNASAQNPTENIVIRRVVARNNVGGNAAGGGIGSTGKLVNVVIELCEAYNNTGNGIGFGRISKSWHAPEPEDDMSAAQHSVIRNNLVYNNVHPDYPGNTDGMGGSHMFNCRLENNVVFGNSDDGIDVYASIEVEIKSNIVFGHSYAGGNNAGIKFSAGGGGRHLVAKNFVFNNDSYSFEASSPSNRLREYYASKIYHNLAYNGGSFGYSIAGGFTPVSGFETVQLRNNIALDQAGAEIQGEQVGWTDSDYNYISDANELAGLQQSGFDTNSITGDAQLGNPATVIDVNFNPTWSVEQKLEHIRSQVRTAFCPSGGNLVNMGTRIDDYHNSGAGDYTGESSEVWYGNAPDIGPCEFVE